MASEKSPLEHIDRILEGEPIEVGDRTVQPMARLKGVRFGAHNDRGGMTGVVFLLQPEEAIVQENGRAQRVSLAEMQRPPVSNTAATGAAIAAGCLIIMGAARLLGKRLVRHGAVIS